MRLPLKSFLLVALSAVLAFGAPAAGSFAGESPCMAAMSDDGGGTGPDCGCAAPAMVACAFYCGFAPASSAMAVPSIAIGKVSPGGCPDACPPQHYQSVSGSPGLQPPR